MAKMKQIHIDVDVNRVIEANRNSFSEKENDILRRLLLKEAASAISQVTQLETQRFGSRNRGNWQIGFGDSVVAATSLKDAYCQLLLLAHQHDDDFLRRFSAESSRTRRFVAHDPAALYVTSPHLAKDHAMSLAPGWYVDVNLSESQVGTRARAAAKVAGLHYGTDVWIKDRVRLI